MTEEEEFFDTKNEGSGEAQVVPPELTKALKDNKDDMMQLYSKMIMNPYLAPDLVDDVKRNLLNTVALLMENGIPVSHSSKIRTPDDVLKEGMAELGGMLGAKAFVGAMKMKKSFQDTLTAAKESEDFEIYKDPNDNTFYFIDPETGEEIDCDEFGNELEE